MRKLGALNSGWYGCGRPLSASMEKAADRPANRIVHSYAGMMNAGHENSGRPAILSG